MEPGRGEWCPLILHRRSMMPRAEFDTRRYETDIVPPRVQGYNGGIKQRLDPGARVAPLQYHDVWDPVCLSLYVYKFQT